MGGTEHDGGAQESAEWGTSVHFQHPVIASQEIQSNGHGRVKIVAHITMKQKR